MPIPPRRHEKKLSGDATRPMIQGLAWLLLSSILLCAGACTSQADGVQQSPATLAQYVRLPAAPVAVKFELASMPEGNLNPGLFTPPGPTDYIWLTAAIKFQPEALKDLAAGLPAYHAESRVPGQMLRPWLNDAQRQALSTLSAARVAVNVDSLVAGAHKKAFGVVLPNGELLLHIEYLSPGSGGE